MGYNMRKVKSGDALKIVGATVNEMIDLPALLAEIG